ITLGLQAALHQLEAQVGRSVTFRERWACSSAAGGLGLVAVGAVPELTAEAARRAALGAGAKVLGTFAYRMGAADVARLESLDPDVILLAGGTDGGNRDIPLHNAARIAGSRCRAPVVVACNERVAPEAAHLLEAAGREV